MASYLVTGIAGFIGSHLAWRLLDEGHRVVGIDNLSTGCRAAVPPKAHFIEGNAHSAAVISSLSGESFDAIFHMAGQSGGEASYDDPVYDLQSNTQSTLLLLDFARKNGCRRVIYASSVSVYGDGPCHPEGIKEESATVPRSFYGVGKMASENYLRIYAGQFDLETVALRLFNIYGPGQNLRNLKQGMMSIYISQALTNRHIEVRGELGRFRDLVYIEDAINACMAVLSAPVGGYAAYNVCTQRKTTVRRAVDLIIAAFPYPVTVSSSGSTPGDIFGYTGDHRKLHKATGWSPSTSVEDGLERMVVWALENGAMQSEQSVP